MPSNGKKNNDRNVTEWKRKHRSAINVAKGLAGMTFEALAPGIKETATSAQDALRESKEFVSKAKNQVSGQAGSIEGNTLGRKAMGIIKDAFNDLKNGSYGIDNMSDDSYDMEADFDSDIRDYDSGISSSTDPETTSMFEAKKNTAMLGKVIAHGNATTISSFANMTKTISNTTLKAAQAQTAQLTNVMLTSMSAQNAQMSMANGKLEAINSNLVNIIEFNNNTQAEYYQKSAEFQSSVLEMMNSFGESLAKMQDIVERKEEYDEFDFSRGFNFGSYKDMVKKNISSSTFGMLGSSLSMVSSFGGNPITMALPMALEFLTPGLIKNPIKRFDKNITKGIENLIYRLGDLEYSNSIFAPLGEFLGKKRKSIANMNMGNYKKDAMSWNGVAQRYLTEVIPSYLSKIEAGINGTPERYYHEGKGRFQTIKDLDKDFNKRMTGAYEFGMRDFSTELQNQMKKNGISEQEVELIMNRMNAQLLETVQSTSKNQGSNRIKSQQLLNSSLKGKLDNATIQELIHTMNDNVTETINNMSDFLKNMDNGYRHLYNKTGQKKDPTVRVRGNIKNTKAYSLTGELLSDMNKEDRELAEKKLENKEEGFIGNILKFLKGESSKNGNLPSDKFSRWLYNIMSGVKTNDDDIDISYLDEIMERQALEERKFKKKNQTQNKPKQKKGGGKKGKKNKASNIHSARSSISNEDDDSDDDDFYEFYREDIRTMVSSIVSSNIKSSGGIGWSQDDHDALTKVIPDKLDKIEKAISKLGENFTPPTGGGNATGQSSNTKPTGGSNKHGLTSFKEALTSTADKIEQKAKQAQAKLNNASKGNESGPGSNNLSSADIIANRLQENENSLANMVQATNDNFMAPMVGGIFGKDGMIRKFFSKDNLKAIGDKLFNEDSGIFKNFGSWFKDQMDYVKYVFTGKGYTDRKGNKYEEKKDSVFDHLANGYDWVYTKTMQHIFGDDYKENENYNKYFKRFDFKSRREKKRNKRLGLESEDTENISKESEDAIAHGNATQASGKVDTSSNIDPSNKSNGTINDQINDLIKLRDSGKTGEAAKKRINKELNELYHKRSAENKKNKKSQESSNESVSDNIVKETQKAVKEVADNIRNAGKKVVDKTIGDISDKDIANDQKKFTEGWKDSFKKFLPVGIAGALVGGGIGALTSLQGGGTVAPLFFSGGPIAGAVLGISATLLARSEKFKKVLFGEEGEDGEKRGGLISQKTQNFFKKHAPLLVGGAAIGALKGVFKTAVGGGVVGGPGGFLLNSLLPGGIIGGAVLGLGVALLKSSDTFKNILFGNKDDDGSDTKKESKSISKKLSEAFAKSGHFVKGGLKGAAIGVGSGIALGSMGIMGGALSVGGPVGMGILGLGLGIASQADRVKTMLFGEEEFDGNGNTKGRKKNGLFPRMRNYLVMNVFEPLKDHLQEKVEDFGFWLKKHITYPFRLAFGPIIDSFREIRKNISDTIKNVFENVALSISKTVKTAVSIAFKPVTNAFKKVGKNITNVAFNGMKMALAPLSLGLNLVKFGSRKLRKKALGQRTKTLRQHAGIIFRDVKDKTLQQWENDDREYAPGILGGIDKFLTHGRDIFRNTREGIDAAKASYNTGMKQQGFNSLGWMNIDAEKKKDKETRQMLKNDRKYWKNIDAVRRDIATENKHSEIFASGDALKSYKKRLKKAGFKHIDLIQNSNDLNDLLYNKADFLERIKKGDRNVIKDSNATMNFYESTKDYQKRIMDKFDVITKEFMKFATQNAVARRKNLDIKDVSDIDKNLMQAGLTWEDIGIDRGDLTDIITLSDRDWKTYMNERLKPENRGRALYDDVIRDILEKQAADAEKKGETNQEVIERLDALNEISEANARMNASEQMGDTGASESEIEKAAGHDFGNGFDDPITRYKKEKEKAEARAREGLESEKIRKGHKSSQDEDEEDKDKGKDDDKTSEKDKKSVFGGIWDGVSGLLGGVGNLFGSKSFWKYAGIAAIAGATFGPWAKDVFSKILKVLEPVTTFLGEKVKAGATWLSAHLPDIASHLVSNLVDNMGLIVSSVWKLAGSVVSTVAKKMVNGIFHVVGMNGPFEDVETSVNETKTFETEKEAQDYGNLTGKNVDGKTVHGTSEYVDDEGKFHRTAKGNVLGAAGKNSLLYATSNLHRKSKWLATWPAKLGVATTKFASRKLTKPIFAVGKGAKWVAKNTLGKSEKVSKILTKILNGLKKIKDKAVKILKLKSGSVWDTVCEKAIKMIEKVFVNNPQMQAKLTEKIISVNTKGFSKLFLPIAIGMGVYDAFTGASKKTTAYLFGIDEDAVDGKMQTISALLKVLSGLPVFGWIDLIAEVYYQFSGNDLRQEFARWLYNLLPGGDKDALQDEIDRYELEYEKYKNENNLNLDMGAYREVRRKNKQKIDFSKWDASDEELAEYQQNKYNTVNYTSKSNSEMNSNNTPFYSGTGSYDVAADDPSNVGFGIGDSRRKQRHVVGYGNSMQADPRWANYPLGKFPSGRTSTMATGGCGPTALSMVASSASPIAVAQDAKNSGYIKDGGATTDLFTKGAKKYGLNASNVSRSSLENTLKSGNPTILSGKSSVNGPYTEAGHVIVAKGMDSAGNTIVNDPMRGTRKIKASELSKGMTHGWSYSNNVSYGFGDVAGYGGINMMSMGNAMHQSIYNEQPSSKGNYFIYKGKKYKQVIDAKGESTWQQMGFLDLFNHYTKIDSPKGFDPDTALSKGGKAENLINVNGTTYDVNKLNAILKNDLATGGNASINGLSSREMSNIKIALKEVEAYKNRKTTTTATNKSQTNSKKVNVNIVRPTIMQEYGKSLNQGIKNMFPDSDHSITEKMLANKYGFATSDNPQMANGAGPNALLEAVNQGTLKTEDAIRRKINVGYQATDGEYNFNRAEFYQGLKVADIKAMAEYMPSLLTDPKIPKFKAIYNYYVKSGQYPLKRDLRENEIADIFGRSDFVKALGGNGIEGDYEYKYGFPFYQTLDTRWANIPWRGLDVKNRGGDLASLAMVATAFSPYILDPGYIYDRWIGKNSSWYDSTKGLKFDKVFSDDGYPAQKAAKVNKNQVKVKKLMSYNTILQYLKANKPVVMTGYRYKGSPFGGYYDKANAPLSGPDDYATVVARAANDAHVAILNPYSTRTQNGIFDVHKLNDLVGKGGIKSVKEAYGITGPSGGGITKVDLSEKSTSTSDYKDLSKEKGLGKIIALFENFAAIGNHLFDALLGTEDYVSIFDEIEGEGGIDEEDNGKGGKDTSSKTTTTTTTTTTTNSSGDTTSVSGINNGSLNTNGKVNCYLYRNAYYLQLGTNYYKRITDEEYTRLNSEGSIILNSSVPHNLMTGTARIYGVANSGQVTTSTGQNVLRNTPTSKNYIESGTIGMPTVTPSSTISTVGGNDLNSAMSTLDKMSTTSKKKTGLISAIKNWIKKLPSTNPNASKVSNVDFNRFSVGGASRDLVFGPGDSERDKQKAAWANKKKTYTKTASQKALSNQIKTILNKKARTGKLTPSEEKILAEYNARIQSNAPKQPYSYSVLLNDTTATTPTTSAASTTATSDSGVYSQIQIPEIQKFNTTYFGGMNESPNRSIEYLAMHYTAGTSSATGAANGIANYFNSPEAGGTADFIVDDGSIVQFNPDPKKYFCHAVGDNAITGQGTTSLAASLHGTAGNPNSISIEMCSSIKPGGNSNDAMDPNWYITEETENNAAGLAAKLLKDYNIPQDHLIMHHHVSGKICPAPWVQDESKLANWEAFKQKVATGVSGTTNSVGTSDSLSGTTTTTTETTTAEAERDFDKLSSGAYMTAIANATIAASMGDDYEQAKQHYLEAAYDQQFGGPETTTTTTTTTTPGTTDASNSISATSGSGTVSTLDPNNVPQSVWNYFTSKGYSTYGTAGIMGNMNHESGMIVNRKQGDFSNGYTASADYTKAADAGSIDFVNDSIGYGLVQFTYHTLKQSLLNRAKSEGKSVGDLGVQLDEIDNYLNGNGLAGKLKAATSVRQASNIFLHEYERPADQSAAVEATRASAGESFFAQFAKSTGYGPGPDGKNILQILSKKNPLNYRAKRSRAVGYGGNWLEICAEVKRQMNAQCAAKGQWYSWYDYVPISVNGVDISIRQDCSGYVGGCLTVYGCANMLNTATPAYYRGNQDLINAGFKDMDWPGQENLLPGDIIVDTNPGAGGHVEVYAGNGQVYSAGSDAAIQNPGTTGISRSSYPIVWRPSDAGAVGSIAQSSNATNSTNSTTTTTETTENKPEYMDPFTRMISGFNNIALTTTKGRAIAFGDGDNPETFFTNTLGGNISSTYGRRSGELGNEFHRGMDIEAPSGRKIYSPVNGKIVSKGSDVAGYGNYAVVRDRRGKNHIFAHMKNPSVYGIGDDIGRYDVLGEVGSTGRSTGSHLHYEIRNNGNKYSTVDPSNYSYKDDISKSLNIHNANQSIGTSQTETASVGSGNRDIDTNSVKEKLNVAINTKSIEGKMDTMIEALQMMVENTSHTINTATPSITQNNTTVYGNGDKKTTTTKKQIEKKDETRTREGDILVGMHKVIAKRG